MKWENLLLGPLNYGEVSEQIKDLGQKGFELVSAYQYGGWHFAALKREMPADAPAVKATRGKRVTEN